MAERVKYSNISRYKSTPRAQDGKNLFVMEDEVMLYPADDDEVVVVQPEEEGRLDLVAYRVYQNPLLSWVLARRNNILNPLEIKAGNEIYCPSVSRVYKLGSIMNRT